MGRRCEKVEATWLLLRHLALDVNELEFEVSKYVFTQICKRQLVFLNRVILFHRNRNILTVCILVVQLPLTFDDWIFEITQGHQFYLFSHLILHVLVSLLATFPKADGFNVDLCKKSLTHFVLRCF